MPHIRYFVHSGEQLFVRQQGEHVVQNVKARNSAPRVTAACRVRLGSDSPVSPRLAGVPKSIIGMNQGVILYCRGREEGSVLKALGHICPTCSTRLGARTVVKIRSNDQNILKISIILLLHELLERAKVFFGIAQSPVLNE